MENQKKLCGYARISLPDENEERQTEGFAAAKARGQKFGRLKKSLSENFYEVCKKWKSGEIGIDEAVKETGMPVSTFKYKAGIYVE